MTAAARKGVPRGWGEALSSHLAAPLSRGCYSWLHRIQPNDCKVARLGSLTVWWLENIAVGHLSVFA